MSSRCRWAIKWVPVYRYVTTVGRYVISVYCSINSCSISIASNVPLDS